MKNSRRASWNGSVRTSMRDSTQACPEASTTTNTVMQTKTYEYMQLYMCQDMQSTSEKKLLFWPVFLKGEEPPHVTLNRDDRRHVPVSHGPVLQYKAFCKSFPLYYHINVWVKAVMRKQTVPYWIFFIMTAIQMCGQKHENSKKGGNHLQDGLFNVIRMFNVKLLQS